MLRYFTAGESHGECLTAIVEGLVAGLKIKEDDINEQLARRQQGYGRGARMKLETDTVHFTSGLRKNESIGSPITMLVKNKDHSIDRMHKISNPRPGHADLAGAIKYDRKDIRDILERSSARETTMRVAVGALARTFLKEFGIEVASHIVSIGKAKNEKPVSFSAAQKCDKSPVRCCDKQAEQAMIDEINEARRQGSSAGGVFEVIVHGAPIGLGSHVQWDRKLDARLAFALMSIQAMKGVEFGSGFEGCGLYGHELHDGIKISKAKGIYRPSNRAGGFEGGMTNGEDIVVRVAMKPLSTLIRAMDTVDIHSKESRKATVERTDTCAVPAAGVIGEAVVAWEIAQAMSEKFAGDSLKEMQRNFKAYQKQVAKRIAG